MVAVAVAFDGTRVNDADAATDYGHWGGSGPAPASEPQLRYQYSGTGTVGAVNKKMTSTGGAFSGIDYDPGAAALSMLSAANRLWFAKVYVSDFSDLNTTYGVKIALGSSLTTMIEYNVAGSGANRAVYAAYPAQGGYLIVPIDPRILAFQEAVVGVADLAAVDWFGFQTSFVAGGAKDVNAAIDAIDIGTGLTLTRGDAGSTEGTYEDFSAWDQDTLANRYGVTVSPAPGLVVARGILTIGESGNPTEFTDADSVLLFPDGYHSAGSVGVVYVNGNASDIIIDSALAIGQGAKDADQDTRPDLHVEGTSGAVTFDGKPIRAHRRVTLNNSVSAVGLQVSDSGQIDPTNSDYGGFQTLDGTGDYLATSAVVARTMTNGDTEIICRYKATDWTPAAAMQIFDWSTGANDGYEAQLLTSGAIRFIARASAASTTLDSSALPAVAAVDAEWLWLRFLYDASVASCLVQYSLDPADTPPLDVVWVTVSTPTGTARTPSSVSDICFVGAANGGLVLWTGDVSYFSLWDGPATDELQVMLGDWRTGVDFTGGTPARPDGIQSVNWEENGDPVYTQGDDNTTAADLDSAVITNSDSAAALRWDVNADPNGELDNIVFDVGAGGGHAIEFGKNTPATITLTGPTFIGYNAVDGNADSTFYNNTGGALTINVVGGTGNTTYRNGVGASTTVVESVTLTLQNVVSGSQCAIYAVDDDSELMNEAAAGGDVTEPYGGTTPRNVIIRVRKASADPKYKPYVASGQIAAIIGLTVSIDQIPVAV